MHHAHSVTSTQRRYTEINGIVTTSTRKSPRAENRVLWMIDEDEVAKDGVPRFFEGLVVLHHRETPFQMVMDVETRQSLLSDTIELLRKSIREADDPVVLVPGYSHSSTEKKISDVFDELDFAKLVDIPAGMAV
jgi:hypothetical protein